MSVETPCPVVESCRDFAISVATVDRFIPHPPTLGPATVSMRVSGSRCRRSWSGARDNHSVPFACSIRHARVGRTVAIHEPNKDHGSLESTNETAVTLLSPTIGTQLAAAATLAAASGPRTCRLAYPQPAPSIQTAEAVQDSSGCWPGLACFKSQAWLGLGRTLRWQAERLGSWSAQRIGRCCGPGMIEAGMGGMSHLSEVKEDTTRHTILWRMTS